MVSFIHECFDYVVWVFTCPGILSSLISIDINLCRAAEARLLLSKLVYEKAKLQLMHVKRDKLQVNKTN